MIDWISVEDRMPEMDNEDRTIEVLMYFGTHMESGNFYFNDNNSFYHVLFDGECIRHEPTHWAEITPPK